MVEQSYTRAWPVSSSFTIGTKMENWGVSLARVVAFR